jgi:hypothetical protein
MYAFAVAHIFLRGYVRPTKYMIVFFNFVHLASAMEDNNTDPVAIWWQLRLAETA